MRRPVISLLVLAVALLAGSALGRPAARTTAAPSPRATSGTFRFSEPILPVNRAAFLHVFDRVRPDARTLYFRVAGLVTVVDGDTGTPHALGVTIPEGDGRYEVRFRFGDVFAQLGQRGFDRVVEHELAHVIDFALLNDRLRAQLDAGIPAGVQCRPGGVTGACAPRAERFAETFAKWASGDLGMNLYAGYAVPPPGDLNAWGAPLAELARSG